MSKDLEEMETSLAAEAAAYRRVGEDAADRLVAAGALTVADLSEERDITPYGMRGLTLISAEDRPPADAVLIETLEIEDDPQALLADLRRRYASAVLIYSLAEYENEDEAIGHMTATGVYRQNQAELEAIIKDAGWMVSDMRRHDEDLGYPRLVYRLVARTT